LWVSKTGLLVFDNAKLTTKNRVKPYVLWFVSVFARHDMTMRCIIHAPNRLRIVLILNDFVCGQISGYQQKYQQFFVLKKHTTTQHDTKTTKSLPNPPKR
jgi:hypothetical protein